jgi:hypothetical protein
MAQIFKNNGTGLMSEEGELRLQERLGTRDWDSEPHEFLISCQEQRRMCRL